MSATKTELWNFRRSFRKDQFAEFDGGVGYRRGLGFGAVGGKCSAAGVSDDERVAVCGQEKTAPTPRQISVKSTDAPPIGLPMLIISAMNPTKRQPNRR